MMNNTDAIYLLVLGAAGIYAIQTMDKRPRIHMIEGFNDTSSETSSALDSLMGDITDYYKNNDGAYTVDGVGNLQDYDKTNEVETNSNTILSKFNGLLVAANPDELKSTAAQQQGIVELRQKLAQIYALVINYSMEQDDIINKQQQRLDTLSEMEELNSETIKDTTASIAEQGDNKRRLIKNNEYFLNRYRAINDIVRYLILFIVLLTVIQYLNIKGIFGEEFGSIIVSVFIGSYAFFLWYKYINIIKRSPLDYDEIMWSETAPKEKKIE
jgi:hypothetical protein